MKLVEIKGNFDEYDALTPERMQLLRRAAMHFASVAPGKFKHQAQGKDGVVSGKADSDLIEIYVPFTRGRPDPIITVNVRGSKKFVAEVEGKIKSWGCLIHHTEPQPWRAEGYPEDYWSSGADLCDA